MRIASSSVGSKREIAGRVSRVRRVLVAGAVLQGLERKGARLGTGAMAAEDRP